MNVEHFRIVIVGGGTAGIAIAARLARHLPAGSIALFEPSDTHYYQPLFTLVGAGAAKLESTARPTTSLIPDGVRWLKERVSQLLPDSNEIVTESGRYRYDFLVVTPGIHVDWKGIAGLEEALAKGVACSNYAAEYVETTWKAIQAFRGGTALFTQPNTPIKCGGAPQKIMYLAEHYFRKAQIREQSRVIFAIPGDKLFAVAKYRESLEKVVAKRGIDVRFKQNLVAVDAEKKVATLEEMGTGKRNEIAFDLLHVTPPMRAPDVIRNSPLASKEGWTEVDKYTLQHVRYKNVFGAGDASSLPTSKTGAAIRKQVPVLVDNLLAAMNDQPLAARYDGYTSCPIVTGYGSLILAEFDYDLKPQETFPFDQSKERRSMYYLKKDVLPKLYWYGMMRGRA